MQCRHLHEYTNETVKKYVMKKPGNYIILVKQQNDRYRPVYVGKAENLEERLFQHLSDKELNKCLLNHAKNH